MPMLQGTFEEESADYKAFVDKFKPKKTTDDCYTPMNVYNAVLEWAKNHYSLPSGTEICRPFYPGGDYERFNYPKGCVVLDNPPFSILSKIVRFYNANGIRFFLFGPALTIFSGSDDGRTNYIIAGANVTYANGANVRTSFVTNMGEYLIETAPDLRRAMKAADDENKRKIVKEHPVYEYPPDVVHAAGIEYLAVHGTEYKLKRSDCVFIRALDEQRACGKAIFGGGYLLSERAAAERAAAERAAAERAAAERAAAGIIDRFWKISEREREIQKLISTT